MLFSANERSTAQGYYDIVISLRRLLLGLLWPRFLPLRLSQKEVTHVCHKYPQQALPPALPDRRFHAVRIQIAKTEGCRFE